MSEGETGKDDVSGLRLELLETLDKKVNDEFDRAKELLSLTIGTGLKVTGGAVVVLMVVVAILGVKTASDISGSIESFTQSEIKDRLKNYSPTAKYQERVDELYDQALIDAYLLRIERDKSERFYRGELSSEDTYRFIEILKDPESSLMQFTNSAIILRKFSDSTSWNHVGAQFIKLLEASGDQESFMSSQADKKHALVKQLSERRYDAGKKLIRAIALDTEQSEDMRVTAIRYISELGDYSAISDLESLAESLIPDVQKEAIKALAVINPKNSKLVLWEESYLIEKSDKLAEIHLGLLMMGKLIEGNPKNRSFFRDDDPDKEYRFNFAKKIAAKIFATDFGFFSNTFGIDDDHSLSIAIGEDPGFFSHIDHELLFGRQFQIIASLMTDHAESNNLEALAQIIKKITVMDGKKRVAVVRVELKEGSRLVTSDGLVLDSESAQMGVALYHSINEEGLHVIEAVWLDSSSTRLKSQITSIEGSKELVFRLETDVKFDERDFTAVLTSVQK